MKRNTQGIRTSHVGRLPAPAGWEDVPARLAAGETFDRAQVESTIGQIVRRQIDLGIDCVGDGEFWTNRNFAHYTQHFTGITVRPLKPGEVGTTRLFTRERDEFANFYQATDRAGTMFFVPGERPVQPIREKVIATGPLQSKGPEAIQRQLDTFKAATQRAGKPIDEAFVAVLAPGWLDHFIYNEYYKTDEEFVFALAEALRVEYRAVVDAGFVLQIDDPGLPDWWDMIKPEPSVADYRKFAQIRIDAVNHALAGIPEDKVRYHLCWGSWHGPHTHDLPLQHIVDLILQVKARTYSFEAGNVRHEHEWKVWKEAKVPAGKMLMPGVVSHATNVVEHPELVADRLISYAGIVGRENVIAGTDCGLGGRVHPDIAWAKLGALTEGARIASKTLWGRS